MATRDEIYAAIRNADKAGDSDSVRKLSSYLQSMPSDAAARVASDAISTGTTPVGSDGENLAAGIGQGLTSAWRGLRQASGFISPVSAIHNYQTGLQSDIDEAKKLDAPLLNTKAGLGGSIVGQAVPAIATMPAALPGVIGGAATGGVMGLLQPVASDDSRAKNALLGAAVGGAAPVVARGVGALWGTLRGAVEPFTESGRNAIAGRTLQRFGIRPEDVKGLTGDPTMTGARTTLAEQIQRPEGATGAARLQDALRSLDPEIAGRMAAREAENNAARVGSLQRLAGAGGARDFAVAERAGTAGPMYEDAFKVAAGGQNLTATQSRNMQTLMRSPAIQDAAKSARANAMNSGSNVGPANGSGSVEGLHQIKLALDDAITRAQSSATPAGANAVSGLRDAQKRLVDFIESVSPEYANARGVYAQMSRPINQMDVAGEVLRRGTSATSDLAGNPRLMPNALMNALRDEPGLVKAATGRNLGGLDRVMEPDQINALRAVAGEVDRAAAVGRAGAGPGSPTAQRLASSNLLRQIGLPENMTDNALVQTLMRPIQFGASVAEPRIQQKLLEIVQNPALAADALKHATPAERLALQKLMANEPFMRTLRASAPAAALASRQSGQ